MLKQEIEALYWNELSTSGGIRRNNQSNLSYELGSFKHDLTRIEKTDIGSVDSFDAFILLLTNCFANIKQNLSLSIICDV